MLCTFACFFVLFRVLSKIKIFKKSFRNTPVIQISLDGPDLGSNYLQKISAEDTGRDREFKNAIVYLLQVKRKHFV